MAAKAAWLSRNGVKEAEKAMHWRQASPWRKTQSKRK
jgi:hypothetical protein